MYSIVNFLNLALIIMILFLWSVFDYWYVQKPRGVSFGWFIGLLVFGYLFVPVYIWRFYIRNPAETDEGVVVRNGFISALFSLILIPVFLAIDIYADSAGLSFLSILSPLFGLSVFVVFLVFFIRGLLVNRKMRKRKHGEEEESKVLSSAQVNTGIFRLWLVFSVLLIPILLSVGFYDLNSHERSIEKFGGTIVTLRISSKDDINKAKKVIAERISNMGQRASIEAVSSNKIIIKAPNVEDISLGKILSVKGEFEFKEVLDEDLDYPIDSSSVHGSVLMNGDEIKSASVGEDDIGRPVINAELTEKGAKAFEKITQDLIGKQLAIILDGKVLSSPVVQSKISSGNFQVSGKFRLSEAKAISAVLNSGPHETKLTELSTRYIQPK